MPEARIHVRPEHGKPKTLPATQPVDTFAVTVDGDDVMIEV